MKQMVGVLSLVLMAGIAEAHDPFYDPAYPGIQQELEQTGPPSLPDYGKEPYRRNPQTGENTWFELEGYSEFGLVQFTSYATSVKPKAGERAVHIFTDVTGAPVYAEWHYVSVDGKVYERRSFVFKDGVWVFRKLTIDRVVLIPSSPTR